MSRVAVAWAVALLVSCRQGPPATPVDTGDAPAHPRLMFKPAHKAVALANVDREPWASVMAEVQANAVAELRVPDPETWDQSAYGTNACIAQANATLAWMYDDAVAADRAIAALQTLEGDIDRSSDWDLNIRLPRTIMCGSNAVDLLLGAGLIEDDVADAVIAIITEVAGDAYERYVLDDTMRQISLGFSQNNHPIRTAAAIGYAGVAWPDHPDAAEWTNFAVNELDYLWGPNGQYVQPDGVISEGPHYYAFGMPAALAFFIAMDNGGDPDAVYHHTCINRQDVEPWAGHGCVEGEAFTFNNPVRSSLFLAAADWSVSQRTPSGMRPPRADSYFIAPTGLPLLTSFGGGPHLVWDWLENDVQPLRMTGGMDLRSYHLVYVADVEPAPPAWRNRFFVDGGEASMRSGWDSDARWMMLAAEHGAARMTLHDHVDGTSFQVAAYGDYLLADTGYYKPNELDNATTAHAPSHNVILIDGAGAPDKGLLHDFGDADAWLENSVDGDDLAWTEARQSYANTTIVRGVAFMHGRYFVVADRLDTTSDSPREHRMRLHLNAGYDAGGDFQVTETGPTLARELAGLQTYIGSTAPGLRFEEPAYSALDAPHVHLFDGDREPRDHAVVDAVVDGLAPGYLSVLAPYALAAVDGASSASLTVDAVDAGDDAVAWRVRGADEHGAAFDDLVWLRGPGADEGLHVDGRQVLSDGAVIIVSLTGGSALLARGGDLHIDGAALSLDAVTADVSVR